VEVKSNGKAMSNARWGLGGNGVSGGIEIATGIGSVLEKGGLVAWGQGTQSKDSIPLIES